VNPPVSFQFEPGDIATQVRGKLAEWQTLLTGDTQSGRELLRQILREPLQFWPHAPRVFRFSGRLDLGGLIEGYAPMTLGVASPSGSVKVDRPRVGGMLRRAA
jgi:hypothetical protein